MDALPSFPQDFLWGASTSAHQVEGKNHNQWSEWEKANADRLAAEAGPTKDYGNGRPMPPPIWELVADRAKDPSNYISGRACDHYNRIGEDLDLAQELGLNAYRFSIEWSRIEPEPGVWDEDQIDHYREVIRSCRSRGIEPIVCLWHWTHPVWFEKEGAWLNGCSTWWFEQFVRKVVSSLADAGVKFWLVLNEPEVYSLLGYGPKFAIGNAPWPPQQGSYRNNRRVSKQLIKAHQKGYSAIKEILPYPTMVSSAVNLSFNESVRGLLRFPSKLVQKFVDHHLWEFHRKTADQQDFVGLNYYMHQVYKLNNPFGGNKFNWESDLGWELYPEGLYRVLMQLKQRLPGKPVMITEHGLADRQDHSRSEYILQSLEECQMAMRDGANLIGYMHWSLLDNFEWDKGFWPEFGLIHVDRDTLERTIRPSARVYAKIIASRTT